MKSLFSQNSKIKHFIPGTQSGWAGIRINKFINGKLYKSLQPLRYLFQRIFTRFKVIDNGVLKSRFQLIKSRNLIPPFYKEEE